MVHLFMMMKKVKPLPGRMMMKEEINNWDENG